MEELLLEIIKEATGVKLIALRKSCQAAYDLLCTQQGSVREPSHELRRVCFIPLQQALETKKPKFVTLALNGFHKILRDDRFHRGNEPEDDSLWLPSQLLCATSSMVYHPHETQVHILRVLLALGLRNGVALNGRLVLWVASRCAEAASAPPVSAAARAAASMTIRAFCLSLDEECQELLNEGSPLVHSKAAAVACFSEIIPVMQYLCSRLCETQMTTKSNVTAIFFLECLLTLVTSLPEIVNSNTHFTNFLWQKFCPALISFLGTPRVDKNIKSRDLGQGVDDSGRGLGSLASAPSFNSQQAKTVYSIAGQLLRLVGCIGSMRPVLEALYHRMLLYPPITHRSEALASTRDILGDPKKLCYLMTLKPTNNSNDQHSDDMALLRLIMDAIEESASSNHPHVLLVSLECVISVLTALETMCEDNFSPSNSVEINNKWATLEDADYRGPLTYQSLARLPSPYRDLVAEMQVNAENELADSSDTSGPEDNHSSASEGELDSDADSVFLPTRQHSNFNDKKDSMEDLSYANDVSCNDQNFPKVKSVPSTLNLGRCNITDYNVDVERQNAKQYVKTLQNVMVPKLLSLRTCVEVDECMQDFASKFCQFNAARSSSTSTIMNADGIYLATYSALLLNLKLIYSGYYNGVTTTVPISEDDFVEEVHGSGVLVYLSATWLCEVYQKVLAGSVLEAGGYKPTDRSHNALINLLIDYGGLGSSQIMCDWQRLKEVSTPNTNNNESPEKMAALKLARRVLTCMWDSMVTLFRAPLIGKYSNKEGNIASRTKLRKLLPQKTRFVSRKEKMKDELISLSLEGLHKAARLSNVLCLQNRCSSLLSLLSTSACSDPPTTKIITAHALSLDVLISGGLELGSKSVDCWRHIFTACQYVSRLEHTLFGQQCNTTTPLITLQTGRNKTVSFTQNSNNMFLSEKLHHSFNFNQNPLDDETCIDVYNFLQSNIDSPTLNNKMSVSSIIQKMNKEGTKSNTPGIICGTDAAKICCALSQQVDSLFSDAASKLNLPALCGFLQQLCVASEKQLNADISNTTSSGSWWWKNTKFSTGAGALAVEAGLLSRAGEVALQCLKSPRPLAHHMTVWTIVGPHFMKAACHKDRRVSKKAIQCIHDAVMMLLNEQVELPHFHFNEALLKPFENLLCLELCDSDVQEQIISCICEFVEANQTEIRSGWRPLFGTLRAAHNSNQYSAVLEIFRVFLNTDNTLVFANAAVDCILCLLSYIKESNIFSFSETIDNTEISPSYKSNRKFELGALDNQLTSIEICKESLMCVENCAEILGMMYNMPKSPTFNIAHRVNTDMPLQVVDALFPTSALHVKQFRDSSDRDDKNVISYKVLSTCLPSKQKTLASIMKLDRPSCILKVWHLMIEGLVSATVSCTQQFQISSLETLFKLLQDMMVIPGPVFGLHCMNHLLFPSMQNWLRQVSTKNLGWESFAPNFKQCCGLATDLLVKYLHHLQPENDVEFADEQNKEEDIPETTEIVAVTFALKELLLILVECVAQPHELIARLGASCIRHIILTSGNLLSTKQWEIMCTSLHRACNASLAPLQQLTLAFEENSDSFYGDLAIVKVAARCDSSINDNVRLHSMTQQVFMYDFSKEHSINNRNQGRYPNQNHFANKPHVLADDRSYIFLLYPQDAANSTNPDQYIIRIPVKSLVIGLLSHQILVQIIATILLQKSSNVIPLTHILETFKTSGLCLNNKYSITAHHIKILLKCLDMSCKRAITFDLRPGLKFLVQKVSNLDSAANLYKHTTASWIINIMALTEIHLQSALKNIDGESDVLEKYELEQLACKLRETWESLCNLYIDSIEIDNVAADLADSEIIHKSESDDTKSSEHKNESMEDNDNKSDHMIQTLQKAYSSDTITSSSSGKSTPKPFTFSDFKEVVPKYTPESDIEDSKASEPDKSVEGQDEKEYQAENPDIDRLLDKNKLNNKYLAEMDSQQALKSTKLTKNGEPLLPAQPIPPEIEQERIHSISKDIEARKIAFANTIAAYLELVLSFPSVQFEVTANILENGCIKLAKHAEDPLLLQRIEVFCNKRDTV